MWKPGTHGGIQTTWLERDKRSILNKNELILGIIEKIHTSEILFEQLLPFIIIIIVIIIFIVLLSLNFLPACRVHPLPAPQY